MLIGGVVQNHIQDNPDTALLGLFEQTIKIRERSVLRIDGVVIGDVVSEIHLRRGIERRDPDGVDAQVFQIIEMTRYAIEIADSVAIAVSETAGIDFVDNCFLPPFGASGEMRTDGAEDQRKVQEASRAHN